MEVRGEKRKSAKVHSNKKETTIKKNKIKSNLYALLEDIIKNVKTQLLIQQVKSLHF
jgi:hypothetical protein